MPDDAGGPAAAGGDAVTDGNTLLSDEELEMLVILRMNRDFMIYMREHCTTT